MYSVSSVIIGLHQTLFADGSPYRYECLLRWRVQAMQLVVFGHNDRDSIDLFSAQFQ